LGGSTLLLAFLLTSALPAQRKSSGDPELDLKINTALDAGVARLVAWLPHEHGDRLALILFAALEGGADPSRSETGAAMSRLLRFNTGSTYGAGLLLMLFRKHGGRPARHALESTYKRLLRWQNKDGGWGYGERATRSDASNTQYALLGVMAAVQAGLRVERKLLISTASYLLMTKAEYGGFAYLSDGRRNTPTPSMTAGTLGSLEIVLQAAGENGLPASLNQQVVAASRMGLWWLEKNMARAMGRGQVSMHQGYFLYALERAMVLKDLELLGKVSWYREGASWLVSVQNPDGSWSGDPLATSFAVLFLGRTFQALAPVSGRSAGEILLRLVDRSSEREAREAAQKAVAQGLSAVPECLKAIRGTSAPRRLAASLALAALTGLDPGFDPAAEPDTETNLRAARAWERWWVARASSQAK
jgi:hypothetical protein